MLIIDMIAFVAAITITVIILIMLIIIIKLYCIQNILQNIFGVYEICNVFFLPHFDSKVFFIMILNGRNFIYFDTPQQAIVEKSMIACRCETKNSV